MTASLAQMATVSHVRTITIPPLKSTKPFTLAQYGHRPELSYADERKMLNKAMRQRRWWSSLEGSKAYTEYVLGETIDDGSVYVICHVCGHWVDAWRADADHLISHRNGGIATFGGLALTHPGCNRQIKGWDDADADVIALFANVNYTFPRVTTDAFTWYWEGAERFDALGQSVRRGARDFA